MPRLLDKVTLLVRIGFMLRKKTFSNIIFIGFFYCAWHDKSLWWNRRKNSIQKWILQILSSPRQLVSEFFWIFVQANNYQYFLNGNYEGIFYFYICTHGNFFLSNFRLEHSGSHLGVGLGHKRARVQISALIGTKREMLMDFKLLSKTFPPIWLWGYRASYRGFSQLHYSKKTAFFLHIQYKQTFEKLCVKALHII